MNFALPKYSKRLYTNKARTGETSVLLNKDM